MEVEKPIGDLPATILCPMCGIQFMPKLGNVCQACTISKTDITIGITKEAIVNFCRFCHRYLRPPWIHCQRDSKQLLGLLLKKIKGLNRARIVNANFLWTESHSKRIKVKVTIQKQLNNNNKIQQTFVTEFIEIYTQCDDCKKQFTPHTWGAVVQVRQHVKHKKTFYFIQQLILKNNAFDKVLKVSEEDDGLNFYYKNTTHAQRLIDFLANVLPINVKQSKQLISHDESSNIFNYKYTFSVELPRICRDDLVIIPKKLAKELGGCCQLLLCLKVCQHISLLDLNTFNFLAMTSTQFYYYEKEIQLLPLNRYKKQFMILDSQSITKKKHQNIKSVSNKLVDKCFIYNIVRRDEYDNLQIKGALGELHPGTYVQGFDLKSLNSTQQIDNFPGVQNIVLVKRIRDKKNPRAFKLKKLEQEGVMIQQSPNKQRGKKGKNKEKQEDEDYEQFLDQVEDDVTLRKNIKLYKNKEVFDQKKMKNMTKQQLDDILGQIDLCDLFDEMKIEEQPPNVYQNDAEGIDELIAKMDKITIEKE